MLKSIYANDSRAALLRVQLALCFLSIVWSIAGVCVVMTPDQILDLLVRGSRTDREAAFCRRAVEEVGEAGTRSSGMLASMLSFSVATSLLMEVAASLEVVVEEVCYFSILHASYLSGLCSSSCNYKCSYCNTKLRSQFKVYLYKA